MHDLLSSGEAARRAGVDKRSLIAVVRRRELAALRDDLGRHYFETTDVERSAERRRPKPAASAAEAER